MKNAKLLALNEIGIYSDSDGNHYESKIVALLMYEDEEKFFIVRNISEWDLREGFIDIEEDDQFIEYKK